MFGLLMIGMGTCNDPETIREMQGSCEWPYDGSGGYGRFGYGGCADDEEGEDDDTD